MASELSAKMITREEQVISLNDTVEILINLIRNIRSIRYPQVGTRGYYPAGWLRPARLIDLRLALAPDGRLRCAGVIASLDFVARSSANASDGSGRNSVVHERHSIGASNGTVSEFALRKSRELVIPLVGVGATWAKSIAGGFI